MEGAAEAGSAMFERIDPITGAVASRSKAFGVADAQQVADRAAEAFATWSTTGPNARRAMLGAARQNARGIYRYTHGAIRQLADFKPVQTLSAQPAKKPPG